MKHITNYFGDLGHSMREIILAKISKRQEER
jgi:hypothetical protein